MSLGVKDELEFRKCARDEVYFLERYWKIRHPEKGRIPFLLRPAQKETLKAWNENRYSVALKARQIGFSTLAGAHAFWLTFFHEDRYLVMLSKGEREAVSLLKKMKYGMALLPQWMKDRGPKVLDNNQTTVSFGNESIVQSLPSGEDPGRGEAVYGVFVDEWAFLPNPEAAWASIEPITDIGGRVWGISTARGSGNFFHKLYVGAKTHTNDFYPIFHPWSAADERDDDWYATKARNMPAWQLHQEYPRDDVECFIKSGNPVFDIDELKVHPIIPPIFEGYLQGDPTTNTSEPVEQAGGPLRIWKFPVQDGRSYVIGSDVAEGLEHGDYSVAYVIDHKTGETVAEWHGHIAPDLFGWDVLYFLGWYYGCALNGVEVNNHGFTTVVALQNRQYPNIYQRHTYDERTKKRTRKLGWRTQVNTKPLAIDELVRALRNADEVTFHSEGLLGELQTFVRDPDGKMHGSPFDDRTMALAISNQMRKHAPPPPTYPTARKIAGTFDFYSAMLDEPSARVDRIGAHAGRGR